MNANQLYSFSKENFEVYFHTKPDGTPKTAKAGALPLVFWPDGHWCIEVNLFLQELYDKGLSHAGQKGGTLGTYAAYLSHLIRQVFDSGVTDFSRLTNNQFRMFVAGLNAEKVWKGAKQVSKRKSATQVKIVCVWLEFLEFVGIYTGKTNFVGKHGTIRAYKRPYKKKIGRDRYATGERWWYPGRPSRKGVVRRRLPINDGQLKSLKVAADVETKNPFIRKRRLAMLVLFDVAGPRRREVALMNVKDVNRALQDLQDADDRGDREFIPFIRFQTVKGDGERECPIHRVHLRFLESYIEKFRNPLVKKKNPTELLNGPLFVSYKSGQRLNDNTFTYEFHVIRLLSGIKGKASPHMLRHRFVTKLFVRLILAHNLETTDELKRLLLSTEAIKEHVREITGHLSTESLEIYIHLAIDEVTEFRKTLARVMDIGSFDALSDARKLFAARLANNQDVHQAAIDLASTVDELLKRFNSESEFGNSEEWAEVLERTSS